MLIKPTDDLKAHEITPKELYINRRSFIKNAALVSGSVALGLSFAPDLFGAIDINKQKLTSVKKSSYSTSEKQNSFKDITNYNNFYELGTGKGDPAQNAKYLTTRPWTVSVEGEVKKPKTYDMDELIKVAPLEERIYRMLASRAGQW